MANEQNLKRGNPATQFKTGGRMAIEAGRKGGYAKAAKVRKKNTFRNNLKWMLSCEPMKTDDMKRMLEKLGLDKDTEITIEDLITIGVIQKAIAKDLRAVEMVYEYLGEDPTSVLEEKRLKVQKDAVSAIRNSDGFMEAMGAKVEEVFEDGGDTPDTLEDSD